MTDHAPPVSVSIVIDVAQIAPDQLDTVFGHVARLAGLAHTQGMPAPAAPAPVPARPAPKPTPARPATPTAAEGTTEHSILATVADRSGRFAGTVADLARMPGAGTYSSRTQRIRLLVADGRLDLVRTGPRTVRAVVLTADGRARLGIQPPADTDGTASAPAIPDLGPIEKRPFDPDRARAAAIDGAWA